MDKKTFALAQIKPYVLDPTLCGVTDTEKIICCYYNLKNGKMCVFGKNLLDPMKYNDSSKSAFSLLYTYGEDILKPESRGILTPDEWQQLQSIHDSIAKLGTEEEFLREAINSSKTELFTYEELIAND